MVISLGASTSQISTEMGQFNLVTHPLAGQMSTEMVTDREETASSA